MSDLKSKYEDLTGISLNPGKKGKKGNKGKKQKDSKKSASPAPAPAASPAPKQQKNRQKLTAQLTIEQEMQALWAKTEAYHGIPDESRGKFMATFPYPYMNGRLHLGHAFTISKAEFAARYQRLLGKAVLFPFAFHCTGMPIQASANKIRREMELYGNPPIFPNEAIESKAKLSKKQAAKQGKTVYQWDIMKKLGMEDKQIPAFKDPSHWLQYFPPFGKTDLMAFGAAVDWRRSFITTSENPFYNKFIEWQFRHLKAMKLIEFGERPSVFSERDLQICADHDRAKGEGVGPQEYTLIKLKLLEFPPVLKSLTGRSVFLVAATLRPETMYGQTNCFVLPGGDYGAFEMKGDEIYISSQRAARNMYYQGLGKGTVLKGSKLAKSAPQPICVANCKGSDLIGLPVSAPNSTYERVYILPLMTIKMSKGTGVVTSVPSDAPDDYAALMDMKNKKEFRAKFGITDEMVLPFDVVDIINIPEISSRSAATLCEEMGVVSQNDSEKLKEIKDRCYKLGFSTGTMLVGKYKGEPVKVAKDKCRADMLAEGTAVGYWEPENYVQSRSGDECVVAFVDQWFLSYGQAEWKARVVAHVQNPKTFNTYNPAALKMYLDTLDWLGDWACSRQFGLGTRLPWDSKRFVIESLSDSTIYMSYYTVAHILQGNFDGSKLGKYGIKSEDMTDAVWDSIFHGAALPASSAVPAEAVAEMQKEFNFWYPMDLRVSGKDLIRNHLTMALYNHAAIWKDRPDMWPRSYYANGHVMVDGQKMSKSEGNFLTLDFAVSEYSADAARIALADAGDTLIDSNFERATATKALMDLNIELKWIEQQVQDLQDGKLRDSDPVFADKAFNNEMNFLITEAKDNYEKMLFREATQKAFFNMMSERSRYRVICKSSSIAPHKQCILRYINAFVVMMTPICPHWCEKVWQTYPVIRLADKSSLVVNAGWPTLSAAVDSSLQRQYSFVEDYVKTLRKVTSKKKKKNVIVYVCEQYADFEADILTFLQSKLIDGVGFPSDLNAQLARAAMEKKLNGKEKKRFMQFANFVAKKEVPAHGRAALATHCPFNQLQLIKANIAYIMSSLNLDTFEVFDVTDPAIKDNKDKGKTAAKAAPLKPQSFLF